MVDQTTHLITQKVEKVSTNKNNNDHKRAIDNLETDYKKYIESSDYNLLNQTQQGTNNKGNTT